MRWEEGSKDYSTLAEGHLDVVVQDKIATVTMTRPEHLNAFGDGLHEALEAFLHMVNYDPDVNVAVLTGARGRAGFCRWRRRQGDA